MKIEDVKIGMKVRIREWDDMERERGLNGSGGLSGIFGFSRAMRKLCGKCAKVVDVDDYRIELDESFFEESDHHYSISADMLEPVVEEFTMPPPDLGEYCGVKVPAWFWDTCNKKRTFVVWVSFTGDRAHIYDPVNCHMRFYWQDPKFLVKYTGQDLQSKHSVDELKSLARLV